jgi:hypothetical protein
MKNYRKMTETEELELNSLASYFDRLMLERYPNTIITREMTLEDCNCEEKELELLDEIYAKRLDEITTEYKDQFLVERMYDLYEVKANDLSEISFGLNEELNDYTRDNMQEIEQEKKRITKEITDSIINALIRKYISEN